MTSMRSLAKLGKQPGKQIQDAVAIWGSTPPGAMQSCPAVLGLCRERPISGHSRSYTCRKWPHARCDLRSAASPNLERGAGEAENGPPLFHVESEGKYRIKF